MKTSLVSFRICAGSDNGHAFLISTVVERFCFVSSKSGLRFGHVMVVVNFDTVLRLLVSITSKMGLNPTPTFTYYHVLM